MATILQGNADYVVTTGVIVKLINIPVSFYTRFRQPTILKEDMFLPIERKRLAAKLLNNLGRMSSQIKTQQTAALNRPSSDFNAKPKANKNGGLKLLEGSCDLSWSTIHHSMAPFVSPFMSYPPSPRLFLQFPQPNTMTRPSKIKSTHPCINLC